MGRLSNDARKSGRSKPGCGGSGRRLGRQPHRRGRRAGPSSHLFHINRILGTQRDWDSGSHLVNVVWSPARALQLEGFVYALDFSNSAANTSLTRGLKVSGAQTEGPVKLAYHATFARQTDYRHATTAYGLDYWGGDVTASAGMFGSRASYESLEGDGLRRFTTPLATTHQFQGWSDVFVQPLGGAKGFVDGLKDFNLTFDVKPPLSAPHLFQPDLLVRWHVFHDQLTGRPSELCGFARVEHRFAAIIPHKLDNPHNPRYLSARRCEMATFDPNHSGGAGLKVRIVDVTQALAKRNPDAPAAVIESAGRLIATVGETLVKLSGEQQRRMMEHPSETAAAVLDYLVELEGRLAGRSGGAEPAPRIQLRPAQAAQAAQGRGLGERVDRSEGLRRLAGYAAPLRIEDWAGPVAGPAALEQRLGLKRSTLQDWRRAGAVIGLLSGVRKHVFPVQQFVDGRPLAGLAQLQEIVGDPRSTWLWLMGPGEPEAEAPLARLRKGDVEGVVADAREAFG